jgi:hypothetical protein
MNIDFMYCYFFEDLFCSPYYYDLDIHSTLGVLYPSEQRPAQFKL